MWDDLTILYYTANRIDEGFAQRVRQHLHRTVDGRIRIVSISQKPIDFGYNLCIGETGFSAWCCYWQILRGAKEASTPFVATAEDDSLYTWEHFQVRPPERIFFYNRNRWFLEDCGAQPRPRYRWRKRTGMVGCIAPTDLMVECLETRFRMFPEPITQTYDPRLRGWGEPGRYEGVLKLPRVGIDFFYTKHPILTLNHKKGLGGLRRPHRDDKIETNLEPWGEAKAMWDYYHG